MFLFYTILYSLFIATFRIFSFTHPRIKVFFQIRKSKPDFQALKRRTKKGRDLYWFHASSVGEYEQARAVACVLKEKKKNCFIFFTVFSDSAYYQRKDDQIHDAFFALPFDFPFVMKKWISQLNPAAIFYARYDVWPNMARTAKQMDVPQYLISAAVTKTSSRWKGISALFHRKVYSFLTKIYTMDLNSASFLQEQNLPAQFAGDTRYDAVVEKLQKEPVSISRWKKDLEKWIKKAEYSLLAGSTYPTSEKMILQWMKENSDRKVILVPHHVNQNHSDEIRQLAAKLKIPTLFFSQWQKKTGSIPEKTRLIVIDETGILPYLYSLSMVAYVGGGFEGSVHSLLEPLASLATILTGPAFQNAPEANVLKQKGFLFSVEKPDSDCFHTAFKKAMRVANNNRIPMEEFLKSNLGASRKIVEDVLGQGIE
ncbi:MAG: hypothetical protein D6767_08580 [Candidatus Hydrogenedentota bacterium]|nr:MAG: hypothetical protein D6767_08580 [Candidatus Hydrogenedentota bacterium]